MSDAMSRSLFRELVLAPGISGFEERARRLWMEKVTPFTDERFTDVNGSGVATVKGRSPSTSILLMAHIDQLGLLVKYIDDNGYLYVAPVGSIDYSTLVSQRVLVMGPRGDIPGVIGRNAIHLTPRDDRNTAAVKLLDLWIDIGAKSKEEAQQFAPIGTPVVVGQEFVELMNDRVCGRIDNRFGAFVVAEVLRRVHGRRNELFPTVHGAVTVQEETALGEYGSRPVAYRLRPTAAIAVDVNHAIDTPGLDKRLHGDARMGGGPVLNVGVSPSNRLAAAIQEVAAGAGIPLQLEYNNARSYTDSDPMPATRTGIPTVYVGNPLRYMHSTVEMAQWSDIQQVIDLLVAYLLSIRGEVDYTP